VANLQCPAIRTIHYAASQGLELPMAPTKLAFCLAFLGKDCAVESFGTPGLYAGSRHHRASLVPTQSVL